MPKIDRILLALMWIVLTPFAQGQDQFPELQKKLDTLYTLTKMTADNTDIVKAGSVLVLHKDGLRMCSIQAKLPITNVYKDGRLAPSAAKWGIEMSLVQSELPTAQIPQKTFDSGDKFWVAAVKADKSGIVLRVYSDPFDDVRYYGQIEIPFNKKAMPSDDELLKSLAEVVTVDTGEESTTTAATSQDPKEQIKSKLSGLFVLTTGNLKSGEIAKAGSIIDLQKDGLIMWPTDTGVMPIYIYKDGKFSMPLAAWSQAHAALKAKDPELNPENVAKRKFVAGEKFWIIGDKVVDNGVYLVFVSDPYQDNVRYFGEIWFPFEKKQPIPSADAFIKTMTEVIAVEPPPAQEAKQPATPAPAATSELAPIAPPPAPPKTITVGQSHDEVMAILGQPQKVAVVGPKEIDYYPDMKVIFVKGKVTDIQ